MFASIAQAITATAIVATVTVAATATTGINVVVAAKSSRAVDAMIGITAVGAITVTTAMIAVGSVRNAINKGVLSKREIRILSKNFEISGFRDFEICFRFSPLTNRKIPQSQNQKSEI